LTAKLAGKLSKFGVLFSGLFEMIAAGATAEEPAGPAVLHAAEDVVVRAERDRPVAHLLDEIGEAMAARKGDDVERIGADGGGGKRFEQFALSVAMDRGEAG